MTSSDRRPRLSALSALVVALLVAVPARAEDLPPPPPSPAGATVPNPPMPVSSPQPTPRRANVVFEPVGRATLEVYDSAIDDWDTICAGPCSVTVSTDAKLQTSGPSIPASPTFRLSPGDHHVRATPGSLGMRIGGIVTTSAGGLFAFGGAMGFLVASAGSCSDCTATDTPGRRRAVTGGVFLFGAALVTLGILLIRGSRSDVLVDGG